jgi:ATP-dependent helicase/nuclease subunit A
LKTNQKSETFLIYRSSAGSGKTYQLAIEFVSLAVSNPSLFNKILAVTFTNKATKEMKERVLEFLLKLSSQNDPELMDQVRKKTNLTEKEIVENAGIVNAKILHNYSQFSISTIDAFFQKIVKSFAKELGLLGNYKVELDQDKIMQEIIDQIMDELGKEKELTGWLIDFSFSKVDENRAWNIRPEIEGLAYEVFKESFRSVLENLQGIEKSSFNLLLQKVKKSRKQFESFMTDKAEEALKLIEKHGLSVDDFSRKSSGPAGYFLRIINKSDYDPKKLVPEVCQDPEKWSTKTSSKKDQIKSVVDGGLQDVTQSLVNHYENHNAEYVTALEIQRNLYVFGILSRIVDKLQAYRQEHDVMLISDVAVFLNKIIADNDAPFIYEKTGSWYRHYLIDEFQDTSGYQWQNFKPLVENGLSEHQKSLLVGDGKQSIYRWRGGDWNLILQQVGEDLKNYLPVEKHLDTNWRSERKIIEFNNQVFSFLSRLISNEFSGEISELSLPDSERAQLLAMSGDVEMLYKDVVQKVAAKNLEPSKGRIEINCYHKTDEESWKEQVIEELPQRIEHLQDLGFEPRDIAILVRKSDDGKRVIERLMRYKNIVESKGGYCYDAVSNESLFLGNSSAVRLLINTIKYGLNSSDAIARAEISFNYYQVQKETSNAGEINNLSFIMDNQALPQDFSEEIFKIISLPVHEMIERIIQYFQLKSEKDKGYLQAFQDIVLDYFSSENKDLSEFLEWWEEKGQRKSMQLPDHLNAMRVMTMHKAKGLEFKAIIVPFCDWKLDHDANKNNILWCMTDKAPFTGTGYLPIKYSKALADSYFARDYYQEKIKAYIDNLNLLYVALTRAEKHLIINCPPASRNLTNVGDLLNRALEHMKGGTVAELAVQIDDHDEAVTRYGLGDATKMKSKEHLEVNDTPTQPYQSSDWRLKIAIRKKGRDFFEEASPTKKSRINYGILVHEILATIKNESEAKVLAHEFFSEGMLTAEELHELNEQLEMIFANPLVQGWFNTEFQVKAEVPLIIKNEQEKRPDRVITHGNHAIVIDFKTGASNPSHKKQVLEYRDVLLEMGYESMEAFLLYISENRVIKLA